MAEAEAAAPASTGSRCCPICDGVPQGLAFPYETVWQGKTFHYRACTACGTTFVDPLPTEEELRSIYAWNNYHARHFTTVAPERFGPSLRFLERQAGTRRTLLDFGCGDGSFLAAASQAGYICEGVEYEPSTIAEARARSGVPVSTFDDIASRGVQFDIVHASDVLPHLPDPLATLRRLERVLTPDGILFIEGPLENNPSLVRSTATLVKALRRAARMDRPASAAPTMLVRLTRRGQEEWLTRQLGYRSLDFEIYETGWPYYVAGRPLRSVGDCVRQAIGAAAIVIARLENARSRRLGNRFMGILTPPQRS